MTIQVTHAEDHTQVHISGSLTIVEAMETRDQLALALATSKKLDVNMAEVIEIDTAGLQLLITLPRESIPVAFNQISDPLRDLFKQLNLLPALGLGS